VIDPSSCHRRVSCQTSGSEKRKKEKSYEDWKGMKALKRMLLKKTFTVLDMMDERVAIEWDDNE
ncbi:unnamed protein product, partial [Sphenostylis stenocarpa]